MTLKINNLTGEKLDVLIEGNLQAKTTVIFVHGFAVDKHETAVYFDDLVIVFGNNYRIIRFDFSGCGESEGNLEEKDYEKWADDLKIVVDYVKKTYKGSLYIFAQSMGCFVIALANPKIGRAHV